MLLGDPTADALLAIDAGEQCLQIGHHRLDLDDQQCLVFRMPRENVDGSALAEVVEGRFRDHAPAGA